MGYLFDTNIVSGIVNREQKISVKFGKLKLQGEDLFISCITYYEIKRGLLAVSATRKLTTFNEFCQDMTILLLDELEIIEAAAEIHTDLTKRGMPLPDADILIAATAITRGLILVSNDSDMLRIPGITIENWMNLSS
ncbi:type II toxin-antitoxin system VapC family toxin [Floridanema evergladense]|uniref:Ribonuclease VapC n=1 Tax=Floridaenema evergladense BLCC-F167 TaxID=3153639 RepID=A0ABV4WG12_9CYAN